MNFSLLLGIALGGVGTALVAFSITRKRMAVLRELSQERYLVMQRTVAQLGSPISSIRWWLELLRQNRTAGNPEEEMMLTELETASDRLTKIMEGLRKSCDAEVGTLHQDRAVVSVADIVAVATADLRGVLRQKKQRLNIAVNQELMVETDPELLGGIIRELIENASSFSESNTSIAVRAAESNGMIAIDVEDQGIGLSESDQRHIFRQFYRGEAADRYKPIGNGLGLYVSRLIAESLGGSLMCKSQLSVGSTFTVSVPKA